MSDIGNERSIVVIYFTMYYKSLFTIKCAFIDFINKKNYDKFRKIKGV